VESRPLGDGGPELPVVGMGTWQTFDVRGSLEGPQAVVDAALAAGARVFDSSPMYGASEEVLGKVVEGHREDAFIATKIWADSAGEGKRQAERALGFFAGRIDLLRTTRVSGRSSARSCRSPKSWESACS
jgi:aryl-alcohol dehydrogenase-like predicted oxidoreductase